MSTTKMTERDILTSIIDGTYDVDVVVAYAEKRLGQMDKRNASVAKRAAAKRAAGDEMTEKVFQFVTEEPQTRAQIAIAFNDAYDTDFSDAKIGAKLTALEKAGRISKQRGKIEVPDGKTKEATTYFIG